MTLSSWFKLNISLVTRFLFWVFGFVLGEWGGQCMSGGHLGCRRVVAQIFAGKRVHATDAAHPNLAHTFLKELI